MIDFARLLVRLSRPSALLIFALFGVTGLAQVGATNDQLLVFRVLVVVVGFVLFSVVLNDVADRAIDAVNLAGDSRRPLVTGDAAVRDFLLVATVAGAVSLVAAFTLSVQAGSVVVAGLLLSASYSLPPIRLADRGAVASMLLPMGYVVVPYAVGVLSVRPALDRGDLALCAALYAGFIGRILLKDFRDVRGDTMFGKRTFLVRHGRVVTCRFSAASWVVGGIALAVVRDRTVAFLAADAAFVVLALVLLRALAQDGGARRDENLISAVAIVGRSSVAVLIAHLSMTTAGWSATAMASVVLALTVISAGQGWVMAVAGPAPGRPARLSAPRRDTTTEVARRGHRT